MTCPNFHSKFTDWDSRTSVSWLLPAHCPAEKLFNNTWSPKYYSHIYLQCRGMILHAAFHRSPASGNCTVGEFLHTLEGRNRDSLLCESTVGTGAYWIVLWAGAKKAIMSLKKHNIFKTVFSAPISFKSSVSVSSDLCFSRVNGIGFCSYQVLKLQVFSSPLDSMRQISRTQVLQLEHSRLYLQPVKLT